MLDFKPEGRADCYRADDAWCRVLVFRGFGSDLEDDCIANVVDLPMPLNVTLHVHPMGKAAAVAYVKKRIAWMDKEVIDEQMSAVKKGYDFSILPPELSHSKEEAEELLDQLQNKNQRLFTYTGLVFTYADAADSLDHQTRQRSIEVEPLAYRQRQGMNSILPLGLNHVDVSRYMTTAQVAIQMPFASQELNQEGGGYYGQSKQSGNLVICNRKKLASPMGFVCGKPGSGKSFSVKREIMNTILAYPDDEVIVFDPAGEYAPVVEPAGGTCIRFSPDTDTFMNPFDLSDVADKANQAQLAFKIDAILALSSATMAEGREGLPEADKSIISRCVELAYMRCEDKGRLPVLGDFYELLLEQEEPEARDIALRYERYVKGALSFFNHQSNVGFENRITNVDFKDLSQNMRVFGMLTALEAVRNRMYANFERGVTTWLYIDEVQSLFGHPAIISYFSKFWAEGRKFNLICTGITQNSTYMLEHEDARNMVLNSDFVLLHKQSHLDRKSWVDLLALSAALLWMLYSLVIKRLGDRLPVAYITRKVFFYGIVTILPWFAWEPFDLPAATLRHPAVWGNLLFLGVVASLLCYVLWNAAMTRLGAVRTTNYIYLNPLVTMLTAALVIDERITPAALCGAALILSGMWLAERSRGGK